MMLPCITAAMLLTANVQALHSSKPDFSPTELEVEESGSRDRSEMELWRRWPLERTVMFGVTGAVLWPARNMFAVSDYLRSTKTSTMGAGFRFMWFSRPRSRYGVSLGFEGQLSLYGARTRGAAPGALAWEESAGAWNPGAAVMVAASVPPGPAPFRFFPYVGVGPAWVFPAWEGLTIRAPSGFAPYGVVGLNLALTRSLGITADVRFALLSKQRHVVGMFTIGVVAVLGRSRPRPPTGPDEDSDRDGMPITRDLCTEEYGAYGGCKSVTKMIEREKERGQFQEPVSNEVDPQGGGEDKPIREDAGGTRRALFGVGLAEIRPEHRETLIALAHELVGYGAVCFDVWGFADASGIKGENFTLSEERAKRIAALLQENGIAQSRIDWKGLGETKDFALHKKDFDSNRVVIVTMKLCEDL
jgi:outer membrane protein OmpA-like peptidoglycan-associated protein